MTKGKEAPLLTPDGRYLVVRGRLWRRANPALPEAERQELVRALMAARRAVAAAQRQDDAQRLREARAAVQRAKEGLGERGPVWWDDGAPDYTRHMAHTSPYRDWYAEQSAGASQGGPDDTAKDSARPA
jgi:hypothetical protein